MYNTAITITGNQCLLQLSAVWPGWIAGILEYNNFIAGECNNWLVLPGATRICYGQKLQHMRCHRETICGQGTPRFVVSRGYNIWAVTEEPFVTRGFYNLLWIDVTKYMRSLRSYFWTLIPATLLLVSFISLTYFLQETPAYSGLETVPDNCEF